MRYSKKRAGFTLVELAIVLGIASVLIGAVWNAAGKARELQKETAALTELQTVAQNMIGTIGAHPLSGGLAGGNITATLINTGVIPGAYVVPSNTALAMNPWGKVAGTTNGGLIVWALGSRSFRVSFYDLPSNQSCVALLLQGTNCSVGQAGCPFNVLTAANTAGDDTPPVGTTGWKILGAITDATTNVTKADQLCGKNDYSGGGAGNSVEFDYNF